MRQNILLGCILFIFIHRPTYSQYNWDYGLGLGAANYLGEMGGLEENRNDFVKDLKWSQTRPSACLFGRYKVMPNLSAKAGLSWLRISGADSLSTNPGRAGRNLSFRNNIFELSLEAQYFFLTINDLGNTYTYKNDFKMYVLAGVAGFYHNPKAKLGDIWYKLRPLKTEGIGYGPVSFSVPVGGGFYFTFEKKYRVGFEFNWRTSFTDYLDDVSTVYVDPSAFNGDNLAASLANRRNELSDNSLPHANNYAAGNKRGDPTHKDSYISSHVYFSYVIRGKSNFYKRRYGHMFGGSKYKKRRIRAKF